MYLFIIGEFLVFSIMRGQGESFRKNDQIPSHQSTPFSQIFIPSPLKSPLLLPEMGR